MSGTRFDKHGHVMAGQDERVDELIGYGLTIVPTSKGGWYAYGADENDGDEEWLTDYMAESLDMLVFLARQDYAPEGEKKDFTFTVTVGAQNRGQARRVMSERLGHDEDYGFDYTLGCDDNN